MSRKTTKLGLMFIMLSFLMVIPMANGSYYSYTSIDFEKSVISDETPNFDELKPGYIEDYVAENGQVNFHGIESIEEDHFVSDPSVLDTSVSANYSTLETSEYPAQTVNPYEDWGNVSTSPFNSWDYKSGKGATCEQWGNATNPDFSNWVNTSDHGCFISIISNINGHEDVMELNDQSNGECETSFNFPSQTSGFFEFYMASSTLSAKYIRLHILSPDASVGTVIGEISFSGGDIYVNQPAGPIDEGDYNVNEFVHIRVEFDCVSDNYIVLLNGEEVHNGGFLLGRVCNTVNGIRFESEELQIGYQGYFDSVGFSWDGYSSNDNRYADNWLVQDGNNCKTSVIAELDGRENVVSLSDKSLTSNSFITDEFPSQSIISSINFAMQSNDTSKESALQIRGASNTNTLVAIKIDSNNLYYYNSSWIIVQSVIPNKWYNLNLLLDPNAGTNGQFTLTVNGIKKGIGIEFQNNANPDTIRFFTNVGDFNYELYLHALKYSWNAPTPNPNTGIYSNNLHIEHNNTERDYKFHNKGQSFSREYSGNYTNSALDVLDLNENIDGLNMSINGTFGLTEGIHDFDVLASNVSSFSETYYQSDSWDNDFQGYVFKMNRKNTTYGLFKSFPYAIANELHIYFNLDEVLLYNGVEDILINSTGIEDITIQLEIHNSSNYIELFIPELNVSIENYAYTFDTGIPWHQFHTLDGDIHYIGEYNTSSDVFNVGNNLIRHSTSTLFETLMFIDSNTFNMELGMYFDGNAFIHSINEFNIFNKFVKILISQIYGSLSITSYVYVVDYYSDENLYSNSIDLNFTESNAFTYANELGNYVYLGFNGSGRSVVDIFVIESNYQISQNFAHFDEKPMEYSYYQYGNIGAKYLAYDYGFQQYDKLSYLTEIEPNWGNYVFEGNESVADITPVNITIRNSTDGYHNLNVLGSNHSSDSNIYYQPNVWDNDFQGYVVQMETDGLFGIYNGYPVSNFDRIAVYTSENEISIYNGSDFIAYNSTGIDSITVQIEIVNSSNYVNLYIPELHIEIENLVHTYDSGVWFRFQSLTVKPLNYIGQYNSTTGIMIEQLYGVDTTVVSDNFKFTIPTLLGYNLYFNQLVNLSISVSSNVSNTYLDNHYYITANVRDTSQNQTYYFTDSTGYINTSDFSQDAVSTDYWLEYDVFHEHYSKVGYFNHNITVVGHAEWSILVREQDPELFEMIIKTIVPFFTFLMFPWIFKGYGKKGSIIGVMLGSIFGFFIMGYTGMLSLINGVILVVLSLITLMALYSKEKRMSEKQI